MLFNAVSLAVILAAGALALPSEEAGALQARCRANLPNCQGASYVGEDKCKCAGQVPPCKIWKCGWDGPHSILNCGEKGSGCSWIN